MMRHDLPTEAWIKSSYSGDTQGQCVEFQAVPDEGVAVRDSKDRSLGAFVFPAAAWGAFVAGVKSESRI
ncbi:DUF397 domain-containing protein [Streptomyces microflavus]|uniref:DUF397 domain-containing protein n=1 Tax=Streptomyces microflavus TaxID=1919 RepID=A0A7J0CNW2_STRMI|nr:MULTISPECIES: DUF397 domain-containing protein [Streptomyces]MCX4652587.1 DUF397 domain-containing protein [Streptomyces microflavus]MDX2977278.1 DUF397 domain-containing protein [Streptomyces sp. NRRL_B-2249]WSA60919.1 DUF397 domain-containing protein [Streptomyces microflavus]GFN04176.1 hypothetical protein Smic_27320 [Streptomyces microflavus]GGX42524.1 hypothetical protein GCM10010298_01610 [Streptomyces microflavus]